MAGDFQLPAPLNLLPRRRQNSPLTPFLEPDGDPLMYRNVSSIARNLNAIQNATLQLNDRIARCERRAGIQDEPATTAVVAPFGIYQASLATGAVSITTSGGPYTQGQVVDVIGGTGSGMQLTVSQVDASGNLLSGVITNYGRYAIAPTYPASLSSGSATITVLGASDAYKIFQIRSGMVSARSQFDPNNGTANNYPIVGEMTGVVGLNGGYPYGNYEWIFALDLDSNIAGQFEYAGDYIAGQGYSVGVVTLVGTTPVLLNGYLPDGTFVEYAQIALANAEQANFGIGCAAFWIEIVDVKNTGFYANVYGAMLQTNNPSPKTFPDGPGIIPIGWVQSNNPITNLGYVGIFQILSGDLTSRWPSMGSAIAGNIQIFRGYWSFGNLSGQMFYNGDTVIDDSDPVEIGGGCTSNYYNIYQYINGCATETTAPSGETSHWQIVGSSLA